MVKMIPCHLISKKFEKHPLIEMLSKHGLFSFDEAKPQPAANGAFGR